MIDRSKTTGIMPYIDTYNVFFFFPAHVSFLSKPKRWLTSADASGLCAMWICAQRQGIHGLLRVLNATRPQQYSTYDSITLTYTCMSLCADLIRSNTSEASIELDILLTDTLLQVHKMVANPKNRSGGFVESSPSCLGAKTEHGHEEGLVSNGSPNVEVMSCLCFASRGEIKTELLSTPIHNG